MKTKKTIKMNIPDYWGVGKESLFKPIKIKPDKKIKSAITSLGQKQYWSLQSLTGSKQFSWTNNNPIHKKDMNYKQASQFFGLSPIGDADRDTVPNWRDCKPYDPLRQGEHFDSFKKKVADISKKVKEKIQVPSKKSVQKKLTDFSTTSSKLQNKKPEVHKKQEASTEPVWYMFVKFANRKWEQVAVLKQNEINNTVSDFRKNFPNVEDIQLSQDPKLLGKLNRKLAIEHAKKAMSNYAERQQFKKHIKEGIKPKIGFQDLKEKISGLEDTPIDMPSMMNDSSLIGLERPFDNTRKLSSDDQPVASTSSPQQTIKINIPQSFGGHQSVNTETQMTQQPTNELESNEELELENDMSNISIPNSNEELLEEGEPERKIPPGVQPYSPVTREQSTISRPLLRAPFQDRERRGPIIGENRIVSGRMLSSYTGISPSRPKGIIPMAEFKKAPPFMFMTLGRKVRR